MNFHAQLVQGTTGKGILAKAQVPETEAALGEAASGVLGGPREDVQRDQLVGESIPGFAARAPLLRPNPVSMNMPTRCRQND
jgi:hypothetical protein